MNYKISNSYTSTFIISISQITYDSDLFKSQFSQLNLSLKSRALKSFSKFQPLSNSVSENSHSYIQSLKV